MGKEGYNNKDAEKHHRSVLAPPGGFSSMSLGHYDPTGNNPKPPSKKQEDIGLKKPKAPPPLPEATRGRHAYRPADNKLW